MNLKAWLESCFIGWDQDPWTYFGVSVNSDSFADLEGLPSAQH